jgi:hypothetical protein
LNTNFDGSSASEFLYNKEIPKLILTNLDWFYNDLKATLMTKKPWSMKNKEK